MVTVIILNLVFQPFFLILMTVFVLLKAYQKDFLIVVEMNTTTFYSLAQIPV